MAESSTIACSWCGAAAPAAAEGKILACLDCYGQFLADLPSDAGMWKLFARHDSPGGIFRGAGPKAAPPREPLAAILYRRMKERGIVRKEEAAASAPAKMAFRGAGQAPASSSEKAIVAIMFTDIQGSTDYFSSKGDDAGYAMIARHNDLLMPIISHHGGVVIKTIGDAIMGCFMQPMNGATAAVEMQRALSEHNRVISDASEHLRVRMGMHYGEAIVQKSSAADTVPKDVFGNLVNVASRIESLAKGGQVYVSKDVELNLDSPIRPFCQPLGEKTLKGVAQPMEIFEVCWS